MQYDDNAEKYGYDGEMTPIECDKLKPYTYDDMIDGDADINIEYYPKSDVDAAIAELKHTIDELVIVKKSAELIRALWMAKANRSHAEWAHWYEIERKCLKKAEEYK